MWAFILFLLTLIFFYITNTNPNPNPNPNPNNERRHFRRHGEKDHNDHSEKLLRDLWDDAVREYYNRENNKSSNEPEPEDDKNRKAR